MNLNKYIRKWESKKLFLSYYTSQNHRIRFQKIALLCRGRSFVDIGCGLGHSTHLMSKHRTGDWCGVDFFPEVTAKGREYVPGIDLYYSPDYQLLKNIGSRFGTVICSEVLDYVREKTELILALKEITMNKIIITVSSANYSIEDLKDMFSCIEGTFKFEMGGGFWYIDISKIKRS